MIPYCEKISGKLCFLRPMDRTDVFKWTTWFNDKDVLKYSVHRTNQTDESKQSTYFEENNKSSTKIQFAVCSSNGILIGIISIQFQDERLKAGDISIIIGEKDYWGKGIATDAIHTIVEYAKTYYNTTLFTAGCDVRNKGSEKSFLKSGFKKKSILRNVISYPDEKKKYDLVKLELKT